ncbi:hypothetical protein M0802_013972 [Mischocyttarus mexicanus]|nr:hypothetical protein M0802_013972 [Mischocyttarus mexicanus]
MILEKMKKKDKKAIESEIINLLRIQEYTLNAVNNYGENLLHVSAAYGCNNIIKEILQKKENHKIINRKNKFGWTPLMQAIRNRNIDTVKLLLEEKSNVNDSNYLGMSVIGLASAINKEMLKLIYEICPSTLKNAENDDITPLCIAALKNDKNMFFSLIDMGLDVSKANKYTHIMMKLSTIPEISNLAKHYDEIEDYWNDNSDNIEIENESSNDISKCDDISVSEHKNNSPYILKPLCDSNNNENTPTNIPSIYIDINHANTNNQFNLTETVGNVHKEKHLPSNFDFLSINTSEEESNRISPTFLEISSTKFPNSPNIYFIQNCNTNLATINEDDIEDIEMKYNKIIESNKFKNDSMHSPNVVLKRLQSIRPADLDLTSVQNDHNTTLEIIPYYSPTSSPNVPAYINDENVSGDKTPTPPRYKTPPRGMLLNPEQTKMIIFLKRYGLSHHMSTFLKEEIDMDLMQTLNDYDLQEIGIKDPNEKTAILTAIKEYQDIEI